MAVNEQEVDNKQQDEEITKPLPVWKLFRYATPFDVLLIIIASLLSAIAGSAIPLLIMIIGLAVTEYADFVTADTILTSAANNITIMHFCDNTTFTGYLDYLLSTDPVNRFQYQLYYLSFGIFAVAVVYFVTLALNGLIWSLVANRQEKKIKVSFIHSILHQDIEYFDLHVVTELPNRLISDIPSITAAISSALGELVFQISSIVTSFVIAVYFDWILALVVSSLLPVLLIVLFVFGQMSLLAVGKEMKFLTLASSSAEQAILSIRTVISYSGQESEEKRYENYLQSGIHYSYLKAFATAFIFSFYTMLVFSIFSLGFWYGGQRFIACTGITAGDILIVSFLIAQLCLSTGYLVIPLDTLNKALIGGAAVFNVIDTKPIIYVDNDNDKLSLESFDGSIQFSNVSFNYPSRPDIQILHGIDLHIKPGQTIAFVGPSGCGKSTIMSLIPRIYDTTSGNILLDGHDIKELSVKWLRSRIGIVSQEPALFNISIALNIKAGRIATQEEIEAVAEIANAHDFIMDLPNGYDTIVGEGGGQISGGQKQRIAIARALIGNPRILLLDEATSALDTKSEKLVQRALDNAREGRTTIIIAHRLSTIQTADVIVGINEGRVVEMGSHNELMEKQGLYYRLVMNQDKDEDERDLATTVPVRYGCRKSIFGQRGRRGSSEIRRGSSEIRRGSSVIRRGSSVIQRGSSVIQRGTVKDKLKRGRSTVNPSESSLRAESANSSASSQQNQTSFQLEDIVEATDIDDNNDTEHLYSLKGILLLLKSEWWILIVGILSFCFIGILDSSIYILMSMTLEIFSETDATILENDLNLFVYLFIGFGLVGAFFYTTGTPCLLIGSDRSAKTIRVQLYRKYLSQDIQFFDKEDNTVANLLVSLTENPRYITQVSGIPIGFVVRVMFAVIASIVISLYGSWVLSLITLPSYVFLIGAFFCNTRFSQFYSKKYINEHLIRSNNMAIESIENVESVGTLGVADIFTSRYDHLISPVYKHILVKDFVRSLSYGISQSSVIFVCGIALAVSGIIFVKDTDSPFYASYNNIFLVLSSVIFTGTILKDAFNSLANLDDAKFSAGETHQYLSENPKMNSDGGNDIIPESFSADIKATNLCFSYPSRPGQYVLKGLDVTIQSGKTLALVGSSGSGKSTILSIIERFYDHTSGSLQLGGTDIHNLNASWLRQQIATVSQEPVLFDMSIADNIRYGTNIGQVTNEEIESAAKSANIHQFILSLAEGYNTNVGIKGTQLSGGQKQRIAIARALVRNPKILLLDEATSALDTESEKIVQEALDKAREGRTTIIIAHRLSTIQTADCIAVVHKGRAIEQGTHSELMEKKGAYYNMQHIL